MRDAINLNLLDPILCMGKAFPEHVAYIPYSEYRTCNGLIKISACTVFMLLYKTPMLA